MQRILFSILVYLSVAAPPTNPAAAEDPAVAEGPWGQITRLELEEARRIPTGAATEEVLIQVLARQHLAAAKATEAKLDEAPETRWRLWLAEQRTGAQEFIQERIAARAQVTPEELRAAYRERLNRYVTPETFSFRYIFSDTTECTSPAEVAQVKARIDQALAELLKPLGSSPKRPWVVNLESFNEVAKTYSTVKGDPTRVAGPFKLDEPLQAAIKQTALTLKTGEISPVISTKYGYEILRLEDRVSASTKEFEAVADEIRRELVRSKQEAAVEAYYQSLRDADARWDIYLDRFVFLLPGSHREIPSTTHVARVGAQRWLPEELADFMRATNRRNWLMSKDKEKALELTWTAFIRPQLIHEDALAAGYVDLPTLQARLKIERSAILGSAWLDSETNQIISGLPAPGTEEIQRRYQEQLERFREAEMYELERILHPLEELKDKTLNPARREFLYREGEKRLAEVVVELVTGASGEQVALGSANEAHPLKFSRKWVSKGLEFSAEVWDKIKSQESGQWLPEPTRTDQGVTLVRFVDYRAERVRDLEEVRSQISTEIKKERVTETRQGLLDTLLDEARKGTQILTR